MITSNGLFLQYNDDIVDEFCTQECIQKEPPPVVGSGVILHPISNIVEILIEPHSNGLISTHVVTPSRSSYDWARIS